MPPSLLEARRGSVEVLQRTGEIPAGQHNPVILLPGFTEADSMLKPLAFLLRDRGRMSTSHVGVNTGWMSKNLPPIERHVGEMVEQTGEKAVLVGRSLGGIYAEIITKMHPDWVKGLIKLGSPSSRNPFGSVNSALGLGFAMYSHLQGGIDRFRGILERELDPSIPEHHIFSPDDRVVVDHERHCEGAHVVDHRVRGDHITMTLNPLVIRKLRTLLPKKEVQREPPQRAHLRLVVSN